MQLDTALQKAEAQASQNEQQQQTLQQKIQESMAGREDSVRTLRAHTSRGFSIGCCEGCDVLDFETWHGSGAMCAEAVVVTTHQFVLGIQSLIDC